MMLEFSIRPFMAGPPEQMVMDNRVSVMMALFVYRFKHRVAFSNGCVVMQSID